MGVGIRVGDRARRYVFRLWRISAARPGLHLLLHRAFIVIDWSVMASRVRYLLPAFLGVLFAHSTAVVVDDELDTQTTRWPQHVHVGGVGVCLPPSLPPRVRYAWA